MLHIPILTISGTMTGIKLGSDILYNITLKSLDSLTNVLSFLKNGSGECAMLKQVYNQIEELDLEMKISLIYQATHKHQSGYQCIVEMIEKIESTINSIKTKISLHKTKWFHGYRTLNIEENLENLKKYNHILEERIKWIGLINNIHSNPNLPNIQNTPHYSYSSNEFNNSVYSNNYSNEGVKFVSNPETKNTSELGNMSNILAHSMIPSAPPPSETSSFQ